MTNLYQYISKFDFQLSLSAQELCRVDVKPYSTFIKKVSVW